MRLLVVALLAVVVGGCQVRVTTDVTVATDGSGEITLTVVVDDELRDALDEAGLDPREGLEEAAAGASWTASPVDRVDATGVELRATFADPAELTARVESLTAGLAPDDGALLRDVVLSRTEDGGYAFRADAGLDPPRILGTLPLPSAPTAVVPDSTDEAEGAADGGRGTGDGEGGADGVDGAGDATPDTSAGAASDPAPFDGDALGELLEAAGGRYAVAELRVSLPTVPDAPGATVDGTSATWSLPVDGLATVAATAPPVPVETRTALVVAGAVGGVLLAVFGLRVLRTRG